MDYLKSHDESVIYDFYESVVYTDACSDDRWWNDCWYKLSYC